MQPGFEATTGDITVRVRLAYLAEQSKPEEGRFFWAYHITIINRGVETVQLLQPQLAYHRCQGPGADTCRARGWWASSRCCEPGERFEYSSGTPLSTPSGFMAGRYHMQLCPPARRFDVAMPAFSLDSPHQDTQLALKPFAG